METSGTDLLGVEAARRTESLAALRTQRMLLTALHDEIGTSSRLLSASDGGSHWRSPAEARYASRRRDLRHELWFAGNQLDDARAAVDRAITVLARE